MSESDESDDEVEASRIPTPHSHPQPPALLRDRALVRASRLPSQGARRVRCSSIYRIYR